MPRNSSEEKTDKLRETRHKGRNSYSPVRLFGQDSTVVIGNTK